MPFWFTKCRNAPKLWPKFPSPFPLRKAEPIEREKRRKKVKGRVRFLSETPRKVAENLETHLAKEGRLWWRAREKKVMAGSWVKLQEVAEIWKTHQSRRLLVLVGGKGRKRVN